MSAQWQLIIDVARCDNCRNCFLATKDEHIGNDFPGYAAPQPERGHHWVDLRGTERGEWPIVEANFMPVMCNHCERPPCLAAARDGAVRQREDGIVIVDPQRARGQREIVEACPYGALYWNEELQIPQGWIFDAHLLDAGWTKPRIESVCPNEVFRSLKVEPAEMARIAEAEGLEVLQPEWGTRPRLYYKNLHLMERCFAGGTVVAVAEGVEDCVEGAEVVLRKDGEELGRSTTDLFGEFKFDRLEPGSGAYEVEAGHAEAGRAQARFELGQASVYLGVLRLAP